MGQFFKIFPNLSSYLRKFLKIGWFCSKFGTKLVDWYMNGSLFLEKLVFVWGYFEIPKRHIPLKKNNNLSTPLRVQFLFIFHYYYFWIFNLIFPPKLTKCGKIYLKCGKNAHKSGTKFCPALLTFLKVEKYLLFGLKQLILHDFGKTIRKKSTKHKIWDSRQLQNRLFKQKFWTNKWSIDKFRFSQPVKLTYFNSCTVYFSELMIQLPSLREYKSVKVKSHFLVMKNETRPIYISTALMNLFKDKSFNLMIVTRCWVKLWLPVIKSWHSKLPYNIRYKS